MTAGVGSDHIDLNAAVEKNIEVLEVRCSEVQRKYLLMSVPRSLAQMLFLLLSTSSCLSSFSSATSHPHMRFAYIKFYIERY